MKIVKVYTKEAIQSLGMNSSFDARKPFNNGVIYPITLSPELRVIKINTTLIPLENIKEMVIEEETVKESKSKKAE